jgi:RNA polymerase sigma factor (sigma-70 family)
MPEARHFEEEIDAWVTSSVQRALAFAVTLVRSRADAEDIVQDCYERLLAKSKDYDLPRDGNRLLFRAIVNGCINWTQRRPPTVSLESAAESDQAGNRGRPGESSARPEQQAMAHELAEAVAKAVAELPVTQRAAVELSSMGHTPTEIAEMLEVTHANARVLLHRGRQSLALRLKPFLEEPVR